jgi:hypothetical protein
MRTKVFLIFPLVGLAVAMIGTPPSQGADPFVAGGRSSRAVAVDRSASERARGRAAAVGRALGLGGVRQTVTRLDDRFEHRVYDEIASFDAAGREVGLTRLDTDGRLLLAVRLGWSPGTGRPIAAAGAADRASAIAEAAGLAVVGRPEVRRSSGAGGWIVRWPRLVDGVPVRGDGVRVTVWSDGSFHAVTHSERQLDARPAAVITAAVARAAAEIIVADRFRASADGLRVIAVEQAWLAPNDTWEPSRPDAPAATLRLAWVVRFESSGALAERMKLVEFWLDAADGALIGGDIAE